MPANPSKISRWENALVRVPYTAVRRYEELLELPRESLVPVIDTVNRYAATPVGGTSALDRGWRHKRESSIRLAERLLDKLTSNEIMTGSDWDKLTCILSDIPEIVLVPSSIWTDIAGRLVSEMVITDGYAWMRRFEGLNRLLGHPSGQRATIAVCASLAADKANQQVLEAIAALDGTNHSDASQYVVSQLTNPTSDTAFYGALLACVRKTRHNHMNSFQIRRLLNVIDDLIVDSGPGAGLAWDDLQALAAKIRFQLTNQAHVDLNMRLRRSIVWNPAISQVLSTGHLVVDKAPVVFDRILSRTITAMPREIPGFDDEIFPILLDELLFDPVLDVRLYDAVLIEASPYCTPLAAALTSELANPRSIREVNLAITILGALRVIGGIEQRPVIERLVIAPGLPAATAASAAHTLGHIPGQSSDSYWRDAIAHWSRRWRVDNSPGSASALHDLVYALGMAGKDTLIAMIRDDVTAPGPVRAVAEWWLSVPDLIRTSARH